MATFLQKIIEVIVSGLETNKEDITKSEQKEVIADLTMH